jgi:exopolysaccharide biosynthesis polyprenyl glycosylphosphotransferase
MSIASSAVAAEVSREVLDSAAPANTRAWPVRYIRRAALFDCACALAAGLLAAQIRFGGLGHLPISYLVLTCALPVMWWLSMLLSGGYDARFIGSGSDEFRRVLDAAVSLAAGAVVVSYAAGLNLSRSYVGVALPTAALLDLGARYRLRKRLHLLRSRGFCTRRVVAVGHAAEVADLVATLRRDSYHGLSVVAACLASPIDANQVADVPVAGLLDSVAATVSRFGADTVAVLACPELGSYRLRELAWELEKTGTDLCVAPTLLDVAGPRTTIRPVAGLPLIYLDHPELVVGKQLAKSVFDKALAIAALVVLAPLFVLVALSITMTDGGPVLFKQPRVGRGERAFTLYKFRTMVTDADAMKPLLVLHNEASGVLFKIRRDPRITPVGRWLRRWSLDELPQLVNVLRGEMSLVGPRPALPEEANNYCSQMRRRLAVKPGLTGLWQVSGRSDLPEDEAVRLDLRYVENWSFALDLQILWKTGSAVVGGAGAY